jgi:1,4-alpha-glucan branching enzyme
MNSPAKTYPGSPIAESFLGEMDMHLFGEARHYRLYERLGAHPRTVDGLNGVNYVVWAPNARSINVIGSFNDWTPGQASMRKHSPSGLWEVFVPGSKVGDLYKFRLEDAHGHIVDKCDPFAFTGEVVPRSASIVTNLSDYQWGDKEWVAKRAEGDSAQRPISIYEVHLGSWRQDRNCNHGWMNYRDLAHQLVDYCREMGFTHLELLPVSEHPYTPSWGYQTTGYFAVTSRYGTPQDFMYFVDHCHRNGIGVILDWVPAHFPKDAHGLARFDGTHLYEHADPRQGEHPDWNTLIFNYGRNEVRNFLVANALFWMDKYHIDGLRVDAVASMLYLDYSRKAGQWIPNKHGGRENLEAIDFLREFNEQVHEQFPGTLTIAEESTAWGGVSRPTYAGGLGFSIKWNMGWMNDTLRYMRNDPVHRKYHHDELTFSLVYAFSENFQLPLSHDEVVHGKGALIDQMPGDVWQKFANLRLLYTYMWTHPGKKLLFMGSEFGQWTEWNCNQGLHWELLEREPHRGIQKLIGDLNRIYRENAALFDFDFHGDGFEWIDCCNSGESLLSYLRKGKNGESLVIAANFTPVVRRNVRFGVPLAGQYREIFCSDSLYYGGSNVGNPLELVAEEIPTHGRPYSLALTLPPLGAVILRPDAKLTV